MAPTASEERLKTCFPSLSLKEAAVDPAALKEVSAKVASHYQLIPVGWEGEALKIAVSWPISLEVLDEVRVLLGRPIFWVLAPQEEIRAAINQHYGIGADTLERLADHAEAPPPQAVAAPLNDLEAAQEASVTKFVNQMLLEAYQSRATDIHIEPYRDDLQIRTRVDGVLYDAKIPDSLKRFQSAITSRIKIMADLSIAEKRLPQDGRIIVRTDGRDMDLRVSTLPTPFGESIGIRLLTSRQFLDLPYLGFADRDLARLSAYLRKPHGIVLLTGPTGSGKTTTLYAFLKQINKRDRKIITLEDPIEYQMKGITQVQVHSKIGLTFAQGLRAMLRHDPDVMMIGEIRDVETAEIAIRVALTGHLVFSTLHTNDAPGAVTRLQDIGVEPYLISSSVLAIIAQRLVRVICEHCKTESQLPRDLWEEFGLRTIRSSFPAGSGGEPTMNGVASNGIVGPPPVAAEDDEREGIRVYYGRGCDACKHTGFRGRTVIYEILPVTSAIQQLVTQRAPANVIRERALLEGMQTLRQCGWQKILSGVTTPDEVLRATLQEGL